MAVAVLALLAWASVMLPGFAFPWSNNVFHVPIVLGYAASAEGPHSAFVRSLDDFVSGFWRVLALFADERNVFGVFFAAHVVARMLFVAGVYAILRQVGTRRAAALALTGLAGIAPLFKGVSIVGHTETLATYLSHTGFAIALLPGCWWLMLRGRWTLAAAALGLVFNINAFIAIWSVVAAVAAIVARRETMPQVVRQLLSCGVAFVIVAAPTAVWMASIVTKPSQPLDYRAYLIDYYPLHTFVHLQWAATARYAAYLAAAGMTVRVAAASLREGRTLAALFLAYLAVFLFGVVLPYVSGARLPLNLFPLRIDAALNVLIAATALAWAGAAWSGRERDTLPLAVALALLVGNAVAALLLLWRWYARAGQTGAARACGMLIAGVLALLLAMGQPPVLDAPFVPLAALFAGLVLVAAGRDGATPLVAAALAATFVGGVSYPWPVAALAVAIAVGVAVPRWAAGAGLAALLVTAAWLVVSGQKLAGVVALVLTLLSVVMMLAEWPPVRRGVALAMRPVTVLAGVLAIGAALSAHAAWRGSVERPDAGLGATLAAQAWLRAHTPPDTPYLPVGIEGFGVMSRRPAWVDLQEGAAVMWRPDFLIAWGPRSRALKACADAACYAALARRNDVRWIVAMPGKIGDPAAVGLRLRFANSAADIYSVDAANARN